MFEFIDGQGSKEGGGVQWNIANNMVDTHLRSNYQIDSFMRHIYYECAYGLKHYKNHPRHQRSKNKRVHSKVFGEKIVLTSPHYQSCIFPC
jgi:hypothetical protein